MSSKKIAYTTTEARERREQLRANCLNEAIKASSLPSGHGLPPHGCAEILTAAKAFEIYITTGKLKTM